VVKLEPEVLVLAVVVVVAVVQLQQNLIYLLGK